VKKASSRNDSVTVMAQAVKALAKDMREVGRLMRAAERYLDENLSRHVGS